MAGVRALRHRHAGWQVKHAVFREPRLLDFLMVCRHLPDDEIEQFEAFTGQKYDPDEVAALYHLRPGPKWVLTADGEPIVIAGFDMLRPGVWQDWLFSVPAAWEPANWRFVTKTSRRVMDAMLQGTAHRLQCISLASRVHAHRWYRPLGLELEGTLRSYGIHGEDAKMFSRLRVPDGQ